MNGGFHDPGRGQGSRARAATRESVYRRRRLTAGGIGLAILLGLAVLLGEVAGGWSGSSPTAAVARSGTTTTLHPTRVTSTTALATTATTTDAGLLAQTSDKPPTDVAAVSSRMAPLWTAIRTGSLSIGMTVFFPETAYLRMKTGVLSSPATDFQNRLVALYNMDLSTYRAALGVPPAKAEPVSFGVDPSLAHWVPPRACANTIGYWHLPNIRLSYSSGGSVSSFGVFSLISWRNVWYVVHLGPVPRTSGSGLLDLPAVGPGMPGPGGGC